jgi:hypothetical protein
VRRKRNVLSKWFSLFESFHLKIDHLPLMCCFSTFFSIRMAACWNVINTEWDPDQETVNFGTRQCVVVDSAIFDVVTLATVECTNPVSNNFKFL